MTRGRPADRFAAIGPGALLSPAYLWVARQTGWRALAVAFGLGVIANLSFAPFWIWPALAIGLSGLVWLIDAARLTKNPQRACTWRVFAFAFGYFLIGLHWVAAAFFVDSGAYLVFLWMPLLLLPGGLALIWVVFLRLAFMLWPAGPARIVVFVVALMLAEWTRGHLFGGLPWNLPGMIWAPGGAISQSASLWGIYGLSVLTLMTMAAPAALADALPSGGRAMRVAPALVCAVLFGAIWGWGAQRLAGAKEGPGGPVVRLIESGVPQSKKYADDTPAVLLQRFRALTGEDTADSPQILVWPEGALPYFLFEWPDALDFVTDMVGDRRLLIGIARRESAGTPDERAYNSLAVLTGASASRGPLAVYDKHRLVPFGEFTPFRDLAAKVGIPTLQQLATDGFYPGPGAATVRVVGLPAFAPLICYEAIFPGYAPTGPDRPEWMVNVSNDSWYGNLNGPHQHAAQARYRAIEEGLPMARVAAGGETGMIDAYGRWTARGHRADPQVFGPDPKGWKSSIVDAALPPAITQTFYSRWRDGPFWLLLLGLNLWLIVLPRR